MDVSRGDRDRVFRLGPRGNIRVTKFSNEEEDQDFSPINRPYAQMDRPRPFLKSNFYSGPGVGSSRGAPYSRGERPYSRGEYHPYGRGERSSLMRSPACDDDPPVPPPNHIPSLLPGEDEASSGPRPLFSDDVVQKLRESLRRTAARHEDLRSVEWDCNDEYNENTYSPPAERVRMTYEEYLQEEENTKQTIDEIIMVAQALRDKIQRDEEMRRARRPPSVYEEGSVSRAPLLRDAPSTSNSQPKIPSLLDLHVEPPEEIFNRYEPEFNEETEVCWNCNRRNHSFINCKYPKLRNFCYRCGKLGVDLASCPVCNY